MIEDPKNIVSVSAEGEVSYTVPEQVLTIPIEELKNDYLRAEQYIVNAQVEMEGFIAVRDAKKAIYDAAMAKKT